MFETSTKQELLDGIASVLNPEKTGEAPPLPENAPGNLTPAQQQILSDNYIGYVLNRPPQTWTARERADVRLAARAAMRTL
jgi:hypothetical protein